MTRIMTRDDQDVVEGPEQFFTGRVTIRGQFALDEPSRVSGAIVTFEPGARTAWHTHPYGQTLIVLDGVGWTQVEDGPIEEFRAGDILLCPSGRRHWHGATPDSSMSHAAIQEGLDGTPVTWLEKVSDEEYRPPAAPAPRDHQRSTARARTALFRRTTSRVDGSNPTFRPGASMG